VVEVQLDLVGRARYGLSTSVLHLLDEVLVALLRETAALLRVEVHVVNIQRGGREGLGRASSRDTSSRLGVVAVLPRLEVYIDTDLVVLKGNKGDGQTRVAAEPELQRDVQRLGWGSLARHARDRRLGRSARRIQIEAAGALHQCEVVRVSDERVQSPHRASLRGELRPDLHPIAILAINALTTNLNLNLLDEAVADVVQPAEALGRASIGEGTASHSEVNLREHNLNVRLVHQISVTIDDGRHALVEVGLTVEGNFNRLHGEVGMALV